MDIEFIANFKKEKANGFHNRFLFKFYFAWNRNTGPPNEKMYIVSFTSGLSGTLIDLKDFLDTTELFFSDPLPEGFLL